MRALNESTEGVLQYAAMGVGRLRVSAALPRLIQLLAHESRVVRVSAALAFADYAADARAYLPALRGALEAESDAVVRNTLRGAITVIER